MLTPAQQKVKQELEELQANALFHQDNETVTPVQPSSKKKWIYITMGSSALILLFSLAIIGIWTTNQTKVVPYLASEQQYKRQSEKLLNDCLENNTTDLNQAKREQAELLKKVKDLRAPSSLKNHQQDFLAVMEKQQEILTYLATTKSRSSITLNKKLIDLHVKQELAVDSLLQSFDREKMKYILHEDGSVHYWVNSKAYQY